MTIKMTNKEVIELWREESYTTVDGKQLEVVEEGEWEQEHKYQYMTLIFKDVETGKNYSVGIGRSGSPFTDWHYEDYGSASITEVELKEIVVKRWVAV